MIPRAATVVLLVAAALVALPSRPAAHEVPARVTILLFVRPDGDRLRILARVPLEAMRDVEFPVRGPGYLVLDGLDPLLRDAAQLWIARALEPAEGGRRLPDPSIIAVRVSLPSDRSFGSWDAALAHTTGPPLTGELELPWQQALLDVLLEVPIAADTSDFSLRPALAHLGVRTTTVLHFLTPGGAERVYSWAGDPGLVRLDPRWHHAALRFVRLGFLHILDGIDHLLFLLCLVIPFRRWRPVVAIITSFTVAHSITLAAAALGFVPSGLWFPPLIEVLIALSIVWMAFENIVGARLERRWVFAFAFGLVHGFGFSFLLRESLQFAGGHLVTSLLAFNVGVELGQLLVVLVTIPLLELTFRRVVAERIGTILVSALVAHSAWHWMTERAGQLRQYPLRLPALDAAFLAGVMRALMLLLIVAGAVWALSSVFGRFIRRELEAARRAREHGVSPGTT